MPSSAVSCARTSSTSASAYVSATERERADADAEPLGLESDRDEQPPLATVVAARLALVLDPERVVDDRDRPPPLALVDSTVAWNPSFTRPPRDRARRRVDATRARDPSSREARARPLADSFADSFASVPASVPPPPSPNPSTNTTIPPLRSRRHLSRVTNTKIPPFRSRRGGDVSHGAVRGVWSIWSRARGRGAGARSTRAGAARPGPVRRRATRDGSNPRMERPSPSPFVREERPRVPPRAPRETAGDDRPGDGEGVFVGGRSRSGSRSRARPGSGRRGARGNHPRRGRSRADLTARIRVGMRTILETATGVVGRCVLGRRPRRARRSSSDDDGEAAEESDEDHDARKGRGRGRGRVRGVWLSSWIRAGGRVVYSGRWFGESSGGGSRSVGEGRARREEVGILDAGAEARCSPSVSRAFRRRRRTSSDARRARFTSTVPRGGRGSGGRDRGGGGAVPEGRPLGGARRAPTVVVREIGIQSRAPRRGRVPRVRGVADRLARD